MTTTITINRWLWEDDMFLDDDDIMMLLSYLMIFCLLVDVMNE